MTADPRRWMVPLAVVATIAFNALVQWLPLNGRSTGAISDGFDVYITPAGYVFAIWSLIYAGLIAYALYQCGAAGRQARIRGLAGPFLVSCATNMSWLALWHYGHVGGSLVAMFTLLAALAVIHARLRREPAASAAERWCVDRPFSLYFGWVTIATLVNLSVVLEAYDARPFGLDAANWAVLMLVAALAIAVFVARRFADRWYLGVFVWAAIGIALAPHQAPHVAIAAAIVAAATVALVWLAPTMGAPPPATELRHADRALDTRTGS